MILRHKNKRKYMSQIGKMGRMDRGYKGSVTLMLGLRNSGTACSSGISSISPIRQHGRNALGVEI